MGGRSEARIYADVNGTFGRAWWDYDNLTVAWGSQDSYEIVRKVGRGCVAVSLLLLLLLRCSVCVCVCADHRG